MQELQVYITPCKHHDISREENGVAYAWWWGGKKSRREQRRSRHWLPTFVGAHYYSSSSAKRPFLIT